MKTSTRVLSVLFTNTVLAIALSCVVTNLGLMSAHVPQETFWATFWPSMAISTCMSFAISTLVGLTLPLPAWGVAFAELIDVTPKDGIKFSVLMTLVVAFGYVVANDLALAYVNSVALYGAPIQSYLPTLLGCFLPCYVVTYAILLYGAPQAEKLAKRLR